MERRMRIMARIAKGLGEPEEVVKGKTATDIVYKCSDPDLDWYKDNVPCRRACPADTRIPEYIDAAATGDFDFCNDINLRDNVLPHTLGRVCAHPCESECRHGYEGMGEPVAICWLKRTGADFKKAPPSLKKGPATGKKIAVVGAGPAGLAAAFDLALWGHSVTIYDEREKPGGMLRYGIPRFRLPDAALDEDISRVLELGVELKMNSRLGKDVSLESLSTGFDAVIVAAGCQIPKSMDIPGENAKGVIPGLDFMDQVNTGKITSVSGEVIVIGGGYTAMDCARTSYRLGAKQVSIIYRRSRNELRVDDRELSETSVEGVSVQYLLSPVSIKTNGGGAVEGMVFQRNRLSEPGADGRRSIEPVPGEKALVEMKADMILSAVSQSADASLLKGGEKGNVFATGDYVTGPKNIIKAIGAAHQTARKVDQLLTGKDRFRQAVKRKVWGQAPLGSYTGWKTSAGNVFDLIKKLDNPSLPLDQRRNQNAEVDTGYNQDQAYWQGQRCYLCNHNIQIDENTCILCYNCVDVCPYYCIHMLQEKNVLVKNGNGYAPENKGHTYMVIDEDKCVRCGMCLDVCPDMCITMEKIEISTEFTA